MSGPAQSRGRPLSLGYFNCLPWCMAVYSLHREYVVLDVVAALY